MAVPSCRHVKTNADVSEPPHPAPRIRDGDGRVLIFPSIAAPRADGERGTPRHDHHGVLVRSPLPRKAYRERRDLRSARALGRESLAAARHVGPRHERRERPLRPGPDHGPRPLRARTLAGPVLRRRAATRDDRAGNGPRPHRGLRATAGATGEHARSPPSSPDRLATGPPVATSGVADTVDETTYARRVASRGERGVLEVAGRHIPISNPGKMYFPEARITKLDVARYYL